MNIFEARFYRGKTLRSLIPLLVVPLLADVARAGGPSGIRGAFREDRPRSEGEGYLPAIGGPGLRFCAPEPVVEQGPTPLAAGLPPVPPTQVAAAPPGTGNDARNLPRRETGSVTKPDSASAAKAPPPPILPDDLRPQVRPEDFLPFFQPPGGSSGSAPAGVPVPPAPAMLPPSSATFMQTSR